MRYSRITFVESVCLPDGVIATSADAMASGEERYSLTALEHGATLVRAASRPEHPGVEVPSANTKYRERLAEVAAAEPVSAATFEESLARPAKHGKHRR